MAQSIRSRQIRTFDVDWLRAQNGYIWPSELLASRCVEKLKKCPKIVRLENRFSSSGNGQHIRVECTGDPECYDCRLCFDSPGRFELDLERPEWTREVLWDRKVYRKRGGALIGESGPWEVR